jgi:hypothetical protein
LGELSGRPGLNINAVTHIRIVDVIGAISGSGSRDAAGRRINDPFPTPFPSSGFDLDAVGVLHMAPTAIIGQNGLSAIAVYPNPAGAAITISIPEEAGKGSLTLFDMAGRQLLTRSLSPGAMLIPLDGFSPGSYYLTIRTESGVSCSKGFLHR